MADVEPKPTEQPPEDVETPGEATEEVPPAGEGGETPPAETEVPKDGEAGEPAEPGDAEAKDGESEEEAQGRRKGKTGAQRERSKREWLERENALLREQLQRTAPAPPTAAASVEETPEAKGRAYISTLVDEEIAKREAKRERETAVAGFQRREAAVRAKHPDYDEVVRSINVPVDSLMGQALLTSDLGPDILYEIASDPDEQARLGAMPPAAAIRELGRLEAKLAPSVASPKTAPRRPAAPAPITPVTARGPTTVKRTEDMTHEEYRAWRDAQRKR